MARSKLCWIGVVCVIGCGKPGDGDGDGDTSDTGLTGETTATTADPTEGADVTYYRDVAPIIMNHCANCHRPEGGIAPFSLLTYDDAKIFADLMATVTQSREMPPFLPDNSGACNTFSNARWLADDEQATIAAWAAAGAPPGDPADGPPIPPPPGGLAKVDLMLDMGAQYTPKGPELDDYRCFVLDPGLTTDRFLTSYQVLPGDARVVHHAIVYALGSDAAQKEAETQDAADKEFGYPCFGGSGVNDSNFLVGWAPGVGPIDFPSGTGIRMTAGRKVVLQIHYNLSNGAYPDRTKVEFALTDKVANEAYFQSIRNGALNLPPGQATVEQPHTEPVPAPARVYGVAQHMHTLGKSMHVSFARGGVETCMVDVPRWDFHWQGFSLYDAPIDIAKGDKMTINCVYDTTSRDETVKWGESTSDEMCLNYFYVTPL